MQTVLAMAAPQVFGARTEDTSSGFELPSRASASPTAPNSGSLEIATSVADHGRGGKARDVRRTRHRGLWVHASFIIRVLVRCAGIGMMCTVLAIALLNWPPWVIEDESVRSQLMSAMFMYGLFLVAVEDFVGINKSAVMLALAATMWTFLAVCYHPMKSTEGADELHHELNRGLKDVGSVVLFLLPAMGVVESIDHFHGFVIVTYVIKRVMKGNRSRAMPIICILTFFLSSIIDNLTATIVSLKIARHIVSEDQEWRWQCGGLIVMAANAGGAWSPIGDVTTTMLWIQGKISAKSTVTWLFFPSFVAGVLPLVGIMWQIHRHSEARKMQRHSRLDGDSDKEAYRDPEAVERYQENEPLRMQDTELEDDDITTPRVLALIFGILFILLVPTLKMLTGLPPYLGMLFALALMWLVTDALQWLPWKQENGASELEDAQSESSSHGASPPKTGVIAALHKVDLTGLLFFTGVLLSVGSLDSAGVLDKYAKKLVKTFGHNPVILSMVLGVSSSIVDNVPLVEATIDMFKEEPIDDELWQLTALGAGSGGSILVIGSIAGVTLMSMEGVPFFWYVRHISFWAFLGFAMGIVAYQLQILIFA